MTRSNIFILTGCIIIIISAFLPWMSVETANLHHHLTGVNSDGTRLGEPGKLNIALAVIAIIVMFFGKSLSAKINLFVTGFLVAWTFRNMLMYARCEAGICPTKEIGLYLSIAGAVIAIFGVLSTKTKVVKPRLENH
ncbi:hypothetical protein LX64_01805 [Chitinophaga skermanii]|uniref:Uncharacterized protein n=1 Tax=Chitinophaga skermanii TaxID=331697 RepID=A0A327QRU1_9BACT|nr:hypothetical protein [Chitinophaga skermanii]RAJ06678.1 hypothetical protein LX64_01805 [Chitinophaga skermanii]